MSFGCVKPDVGICRRLNAALIGIAFLLGACNSGGVRETLDEETFVSVIVAEPPVTFFRLPESGPYDRELVSVGLVDIIASRQRDIYLWINNWGTRADGSTGDRALPEMITLSTASRELVLNRSADTHTTLGLSSAPYTSVRSGPGEAYFAVSAEDLAQLANDGPAEIRLGDAVYALWGDQRRGINALRQYVNESRL
ncbi:MAG: hypothetical protein AAF610_03290 [Pseudomonadota bacterium]